MPQVGRGIRIPFVVDFSDIPKSISTVETQIKQFGRRLGKLNLRLDGRDIVEFGKRSLNPLVRNMKALEESAKQAKARVDVLTKAVKQLRAGAPLADKAQKQIGLYPFVGPKAQEALEKYRLAFKGVNADGEKIEATEADIEKARLRALRMLKQSLGQNRRLYELTKRRYELEASPMLDRAQRVRIANIAKLAREQGRLLAKRRAGFLTEKEYVRLYEIMVRLSKERNKVTEKHVALLKRIGTEAKVIVSGSARETRTQRMKYEYVKRISLEYANLRRKARAGIITEKEILRLQQVMLEIARRRNLTARRFLRTQQQVEKAAYRIRKQQEKQAKAQRTGMFPGGGLFSFRRLGWFVQLRAFWEAYRLIGATLDNLMQKDEALARALRTARSQSMDMATMTTRYTDEMRSAVASLGVTWQQAGEALYQFGSAGLTAEESMAALGSTLKLIVATEGDVTEVTKAVASIYNNFGETMVEYTTIAEKMAHINNVLAVTWQNAQVEISELVQGLALSSQMAAASGMRFEELTAMIGVLNTHMLKSGRAGRALTNILSRIARQPLEFARAFDLAVDPTKPLKLSEILKTLNKRYAEGTLSLGKLGDMFARLGLRGAPAFATLVQHYDEVTEAQERLTNKASEGLDEIADIMTKRFTRVLEIFKGQFRVWVEDTLGGLRDFVRDSFVMINQTMAIGRAKALGEMELMPIERLTDARTLVNELTTMMESLKSDWEVSWERPMDAMMARLKQFPDLFKIKQLEEALGKLKPALAFLEARVAAIQLDDAIIQAHEAMENFNSGVKDIVVTYEDLILAERTTEENMAAQVAILQKRRDEEKEFYLTYKEAGLWQASLDALKRYQQAVRQLHSVHQEGLRIWKAEQQEAEDALKFHVREVNKATDVTDAWAMATIRVLRATVRLAKLFDWREYISRIKDMHDMQNKAHAVALRNIEEERNREQRLIDYRINAFGLVRGYVEENYLKKSAVLALDKKALDLEAQKTRITIENLKAVKSAQEERLARYQRTTPMGVPGRVETLLSYEGDIRQTTEALEDAENQLKTTRKAQGLLNEEIGRAPYRDQIQDLQQWAQTYDTYSKHELNMLEIKQENQAQYLDAYKVWLSESERGERIRLLQQKERLEAERVVLTNKMQTQRAIVYNEEMILLSMEKGTDAYAAQEEKVRRLKEALDELNYALDENSSKSAQVYEDLKTGSNSYQVYADAMKIAIAEGEYWIAAQAAWIGFGQEMFDAWKQILQEWGAHSKAAWDAYKAMAIAEVIVSSVVTGMKGASALADIPLVGPALAIAWLSTIGALAGAQIAVIQQQKPSRSYATGGIVPGNLIMLDGENNLSSFGTGGITSGPTLAAIGDNRTGREIIIPEENIKDDHVSGYWSRKGGEEPINIVNLVTQDDVAVAMTSNLGKNVVVNHIGADMNQRKSTFRSVRRATRRQR